MSVKDEEAEGEIRALGCGCCLFGLPLVIVGAFFLVRFVMRRLEQERQRDQAVRGFDVIMGVGRPPKPEEKKRRD